MKNSILSFGKDTIVYGLGSAINRFLGLLMLPLFTSYLTTEEYGILAMLALLNMVLQPIFSLGMTVAMGASYFEQMSKRNHSSVLWTTATINFVSAVFLSLIAILFLKEITQLISLDSQRSFLVLLTLIGIAVTVISTGFMQKLQFDKKAKIFAAVSVLSTFVAVLTSVYLVIFENMGVLGMVIGQFSGCLTSSILFIIFGSLGTRFIYKKTIAQELLKLGVPMVPSFAFLFIIMHANKYILEYYSGLHAVGIYSVGYNLGMAISLITSAISTAWYPFFMGYINNQAEAGNVFPRLFRYYFYFVGLICICFFLFAKPIVMLLTEPSFHNAWKVVGFIAAANFFGGAFNFLLPGVYFNREVKFVSVVQALSAGFSLPISFLLIKNFSLIGAGLSVVLGNLIMLIILALWNYYRQHSYLEINYNYNHLMKITFIYFAVLIFFHALPITSILGNITLAVCMLGIVLTYIYFCLSKSEQISIQNLIRSKVN